MGNTPARIRTGNPYMMRSVPVHTYHYNAMRKKEGYSMVRRQLWKSGERIS